MAFREKLLVGLMIVALLYGGYAVFLDGDSTIIPITGTDQSAPPDAAAVQAQALANTALETAAQSRLSNREWYILETALAFQAPNPFHRLEAVVREPVREEQPQEDMTRPKFVYEGFLETDGLRLALINGRAYAEGEQLKESGYVLLRISERSIDLAHISPLGKETWRQEFLLEEDIL
ncbi:hypothetical protein [Desulfonatronum thioautotrophicum]|uniref:hypothetical protein n=1 Tax=Desulfonatronum thioautotrophicum TaxID=617001 RepID=UPI0005EBD572|nr:hypothetical protein [Desulfonatronum thioautotrophicum]